MISNTNQNQKKAATEHLDKHLMIIAGPGSGKTLTLTLRIAYMLSKNAKPSQIFAVTFTKKAANDMKKRLVSMLPQNFLLKSMALGTFHSVCLKILRENSKIAGIHWNFKIVSGKQQLNILEEAINAYISCNSLENLIKSQIKCLSKEDLKGIMNDPDESIVFNINNKDFLYINQVISSAKIDTKCYQSLSSEFLELLNLYKSILAKYKLIDLPDILFLTLELLKTHSGILEKYQKRYKYILIDEFQDTSPMQMELILMISKNSYITICGDEDQSIYSWRGAKNNIFNEFLSLFPDSKSITLTENYRSSPCIVRLSQNLIKNNKQRQFKNIKGMNEEGPLPEVIVADSINKEAVCIAKTICFYIQKGFKYSQIAVLYRLHSVSLDIIPQMHEFGIPFKPSTKTPSLSSNEKGLLAYIKLIINQNDEEAFNTVFNWPKRKLGEVAKKRIDYISSYKAISQFEALSYLISTSKSVPKGFSELYTTVKSLIELSSRLNPFELVSKIASKFSVDDCDRLLALSKPYSFPGLESYLRLLQHFDYGAPSDCVSFMTVHQSKGQEWDLVIVPRLNEGFFPAGDNIDEERRLAYVAATRAKKILVFTCTMAGAKGEVYAPSRFLDEFYDEDFKTKNNFSVFNNKKLHK
jgi:DNA helicase II / ATP-dependent DNA helicase PcrA